MSQNNPNLPNAPQGVDGAIDAPQTYNYKNSLIVGNARTSAGSGMTGGNGGVGNILRSYDGPDPFFWAKITSSTAITANQQWKYDWTQVTRVNYSTTPSCFTTTTGGMTSTTGNGTQAYNSMESFATGTGMQPSGINVSGLVGSFTFKPIGDGAVVKMWIDTDDTGKMAFTFQIPNQIDGSCSASSSSSS